MLREVTLSGCFEGGREGWGAEAEGYEQGRRPVGSHDGALVLFRAVQDSRSNVVERILGKSFELGLGSPSYVGEESLEVLAGGFRRIR